MTTTPPPYEPAPGQPVQPTPYAQAGQYPPQAWQPRAVRPPLTAEQKSGARWAGIVGFNLLALGWLLFIIPVVLGTFAAFFTFVLDQIGRSSNSRSTSYYQLRDFVDNANVTAWVIPLLILSLFGMAVWALGIIVSGRMLKSHSVNHPWGVTWAAAGIAIAAYPFVGWIAGILVQVVSGLADVAHAPVWTMIGVTGSLSLLMAIVLNCVIGWLAWWWMAHAMRARPTV